MLNSVKFLWRFPCVASFLLTIALILLLSLYGAPGCEPSQCKKACSALICSCFRSLYGMQTQFVSITSVLVWRLCSRRMIKLSTRLVRWTQAEALRWTGWMQQMAPNRRPDHNSGQSNQRAIHMLVLLVTSPGASLPLFVLFQAHIPGDSDDWKFSIL
jgi:hypothetical protein